MSLAVSLFFAFGGIFWASENGNPWLILLLGFVTGMWFAKFLMEVDNG